MNTTDLEFEKPFIELERHLGHLEAFAQAHPELDLKEGMTALKQNTNTLTRQTFQKLSRWDKVRLARHPQRPQAPFYINALFDEHVELHSDKLYGDDRALVGGVAWFDGQPLVYLAQQKGTNLEERQEMNFGYTHPEGYRKARRLMQLADKFNRPLICFVDTPGAHFDLRSEEYGQAMAIAENLAEMMTLRVPLLAVIIGEGGSGGALAIAVGNRVLMMEYAVYCVAPPEACSGIVWKDKGEHAPEATEGYKPTAPDLLKLEIIDQIIREPLGGAHRDAEAAARSVKRAVRKHLTELMQMTPEQLIQQRYDRYRHIGLYGEDHA
ncbi:acetyl-CoA carboxylase carboxyltransferase subunit alpha [Candidatus Poribacteria bacterium]|nr:acetyl-CoA carboxylase carboxyltransferase subunit alpha [Candidatus Poribacteria bacterium]MYA57039.1 acetyl-CoA carboxylase carboxyltransferase subunit alpha [Candidatus Poribacteria bacterium]